jgi:hypothetical protein
VSSELHRARRSAVGPRRLASIKRPGRCEAAAGLVRAGTGRRHAACGRAGAGVVEPGRGVCSVCEVAGAVWARRLGHGPPALALGGPARRADVAFLGPRRWSDCSLLNRARVRAPQIRLGSGKRRMGRLLHMR